MNLLVERYRPADGDEWDRFAAASRNATFLLSRGYMDYHAARFVDHSLLVRDGDLRLLALLPANERGQELHSHAGLTYGGLILGPGTGAAAACEILDAVKGYMATQGLGGLHYKTIPWIYHRQPAEEDRYALFRAGADLTRRDVLSVVPREPRLRFQERRARGAKAARKAGVAVRESDDCAPFWAVLEQNLMDRHGVAPVHDLQEIRLLKARFPEAIRLFVAYLGDDLVAGAVVYESERVAHVQYISANDAGRQARALDLLFDELLTRVFVDKPYFDFGISNEDRGRILNLGLVEQKEGFGARSVVHDHYYLKA
jgi:hypothetical protein